MLKLEFNTFKIICVCSSDLLCLYLCVSDINTSSSQPWETRRNCQQRRDVAQFCNSPNSKDGRWVCVCVSVCHASFSVPINNKRFAKWLNPWPAIPKIPWNLWQLVPAVPPHHHSPHTHTHTAAAAAAAAWTTPPPLSVVLSARLLLCLSVWPCRSHQLPPCACTHSSTMPSRHLFIQLCFRHTHKHTPPHK